MCQSSGALHFLSGEYDAWIRQSSDRREHEHLRARLQSRAPCRARWATAGAEDKAAAAHAGGRDIPRMPVMFSTT